MYKYDVRALDACGYEITPNIDTDSKANAVARAKRMLIDAELVGSGLHKVEVHKVGDGCVWDGFV